jgi:CheY-like chemotaxis protein
MPHRILIIDENDADRTSLDQFLSRDLGCQTAAFGAACKAFEAAAAGPFDLAVISAMLTPVSGVEAFMRLRSILPEIQAIFLAERDRLSEQDADFLRFSVPSERVIARDEATHARLTKLIIGILGPPAA